LILGVTSVSQKKNSQALFNLKISPTPERITKSSRVPRWWRGRKGSNAYLCRHPQGQSLDFLLEEVS
jgi:hypothetical protein